MSLGLIEVETMNNWKTLSSSVLIASKWLTVRRDKCELPSGRQIDDFYVVEVPDGAAIVALTEKKEIILVQQYKHGASQVVLELPAGIVETNEDPLFTIARELKEETGYVASDIEYITTLTTKPARMAAKTLIYFASDVKPQSAPQINDAEIIKTVLPPDLRVA